MKILTTLSIENFDWNFVIDNNSLKKKSKGNLQITAKYLEQLYHLQKKDQFTDAFLAVAQLSSSDELPMLCLLRTQSSDILVADSLKYILEKKEGERIEPKEIAKVIASKYPDRFGDKTLKSIGQNLVSSYKQAGYLEGKIRNIRKKCSPTWRHVLLAILMGYISGLRGNFLLSTNYIAMLELPQQTIKDFIKEASLAGYLTFNEAGTVLTIGIAPSAQHLIQT